MGGPKCSQIDLLGIKFPVYFSDCGFYGLLHLAATAGADAKKSYWTPLFAEYYEHVGSGRTLFAEYFARPMWPESENAYF